MAKRLFGHVCAALAVLGCATAPAVSQEMQVVAGKSYVCSGDTLRVLSRGQLYSVVQDVAHIRYASSVSPERIAEYEDSLSVPNSWPTASGTCVLSCPAEVSVLVFIESLAGSPLVETVEPVTLGQFSSVPSDSLFDTVNQYNLFAHWQDFESAWMITTGDTTVTIAVLDSGVDMEHPDLVEDGGPGNMWRNLADDPSDTLDNDGNSYLNDYWGWDFAADYAGGQWVADNDPSEELSHGTSVLSIIGAMTNNHEGIAGVAGGWWSETPAQIAKGCRVMPLKVEHGGGPVSAILPDAIRYAADNGACVVNMSFKIGEDTFITNAVKYAADTCGVLIVASSSNGDTCTPVQYPASLAKVIAVGGAARSNAMADFTCYGDSLELLASTGRCTNPSSRDRGSCDPDSTYPHAAWNRDLDHQAYGYFSGTSCAAPQVAALAGLLKSYNPLLTAAEIRQLLHNSAEDQIGTSADTPGRDSQYGYGRINAYAALFLARGGGATTSNLRLCYGVEFDRDVKISSGDTLTLLSGVEITFASGSDAANLGIDPNRCELIIEGTLIAEGTHVDTLVTFTTEVDSAGAWYGIRAPADTGTISLEHCAVENAYKGVSAENPDGLSVSNVDIDNCLSHGIWVKECDSSMTVASCTITDPGLIGIEAIDCDGLVLSDHDISDATAYGIKCQDVEGMTIEENTILGASGESGFVGIHYVCASGDTVLTIEENTISRCGSRGIYCEGGGDGTSSITGNVISDDGYDRGTVGIYLKNSRADVHYNETEKKGTAVTVLPGTGTPKWIPDMGDSRTQEQGNNSWLDNTTWYVWTLLSSPDTLYAVGNWHGTTTPSAAMFSSSVHYQPVLEKAPGARINPDSGETEVHEYFLSQNRPNPFNPTTTIEYSIWAPGRVTLRVYNMAGKLVRTLINAVQEPGYHDVIWDGTDDQGRQVAGGVYFARMVSGGETKMRKLILLK